MLLLSSLHHVSLANTHPTPNTRGLGSSPLHTRLRRCHCPYTKTTRNDGNIRSRMCNSRMTSNVFCYTSRTLHKHVSQAIHGGHIPHVRVVLFPPQKYVGVHRAEYTPPLALSLLNAKTSEVLRPTSHSSIIPLRPLFSGVVHATFCIHQQDNLLARRSANSQSTTL